MTQSHLKRLLVVGAAVFGMAGAAWAENGNDAKEEKQITSADDQFARRCWLDSDKDVPTGLSPLEILNKHFSYNEKLKCWNSVVGTGIRTAELACVKPIHYRCVNTTAGPELYLLATGPYMKYDESQSSEYVPSNYHDETSRLPKYAVHMFIAPADKNTNRWPYIKIRHFVDTLPSGTESVASEWRFVQLGKDIYGYYGLVESAYFQWMKGDYLVLMPFNGRLLQNRIPAWTNIKRDCPPELTCKPTNWTSHLKVDDSHPEYVVYPIDVSVQGVDLGKPVTHPDVLMHMKYQSKLDKMIQTDKLKIQGMDIPMIPFPKDKPFKFIFNPETRRYQTPKGFPTRHFSGY